MAETAQRRAAEAPALPAFADGGARRMLIGADWVEAASGRRFEARNPATGTLLATLPEGDAEDVDRAVAAARAALDGSWSKATLSVGLVIGWLNFARSSTIVLPDWA